MFLRDVLFPSVDVRYLIITLCSIPEIPALANIVQRFGSRVREALATASEAISNAVADNDPVTVC